MTSEDHVWVRRVCEGDHNAYRYLIRAYEDMAYAIAIAVVKDSQIAEEVVQDSFLKAYQRLHSFNMQASFKTWFYRIVTNESLMRLRKMRRDHLSFVDVPEAETDDTLPGDITDDKLALYIDAALQQLPSRESLVLRLFYLQEMDIKSVADITGWTINNIKVMLHRSRKRMKIILADMIKKHTDANN